MIRTGAEVRGARRSGTGTAVLELAGGETAEAQHLLVAVGRRPRVEGLGLETVGAETDGEPIEVDDRMRVGGRDWLYAIGDVNGRVLLTHMGKYQARVAAANILGGTAEAHGDDSRSPRVIFTDPEIAAVGYTLARRGGGGARSDRRRRRRPPAPPEPPSTGAMPRERAGWSSTTRGGSSSARRSSDPTRTSFSTPPRSRSWAGCRSKPSSRPCPPSPPAMRSGSTSSRSLGSSRLGASG